MKYHKLLLIIICSILLSGCSPAKESSVVPDVSVKSISKSAFPAFGGCEELHLPGTLTAAAASGSSYTEASELAQFSGSNEQAWEKLLSGELDIILAYEPLESVDSEAVLMQPIGTDPFIFLIGDTQEPVSVTEEQIITAYQQGGIWEGYASAPGSVSRLAAADLLHIESGSTIMQGDDMLTATCPHTAGTICYTTYLSMRENGQAENTGLAAINGILPIDEAYPYQIQYFVACRAGLERNDPAMVLYRWLTSEDCMQWLRQTTISDFHDEQISSPDAS